MAISLSLIKMYLKNRCLPGGFFIISIREHGINLQGVFTVY